MRSRSAPQRHQSGSQADKMLFILVLVSHQEVLVCLCVCCLEYKQFNILDLVLIFHWSKLLMWIHLTSKSRAMSSSLYLEGEENEMLGH